MRRFIPALVLSIILPISAFAQTLADRIPSDTVLYVGFKGSDALTKEFNASNFKGMIQGTDLDVLVSDSFAKSLADLVRRNDPETAAHIPALFVSLRQVWHYPTALFVRVLEEGKPAIAIICDTGKGDPALLKQVQAALPPDSGMQVQQVGQYLLLTTDPYDALTTQLAKPTPIVNGPAPVNGLIAAARQVDANGAVVAYVDVEQLVSTMRRMPHMQTPEVTRRWNAIGLDKVQYAVMSGSFAGKGWRTQAFIAAPAPRTGIPAMLDAKPISADLLKVVPASAARLSVSSFDFAALFQQIRSLVQQMSPEATGSMNQALAMARGFLGVDIEKELLPALGDNWITYADSSVGSVHPLGSVCINTLRNPQQAEAALLKMQNAILTTANNAMAGQRMAVRPVERKVGQTTVHTIPLPGFAPSWAVRDGKLYLALYPQLVVAATDFANSGGKSFSLATLAATLPQGIGPQSLSYSDLPQLAPAGYGSAMLLTHYLGILDMFGLPMPMMTLPPLPEMQKYLSPVTSVTWTDATGWHMQHIGPFPGSDVLGAVMMPDLSMVQGPLAASILLPSLSRAREKANQVKCASNMRQIGQAAQLFAQDNMRKGAPYPTDLGEMILTQQISVEVFTCPSGNITVPASIRNASKEEQAEWANENSPYVWLGKGLKVSSNPEFVVMYERMNDHHEGCNVLFADGHVEFVQARAFDALMNRVKQLGQKLPEVAPF